MATADGPIDLDWSGADGARVDRRTLLAASGLLAVACLYAYDYAVLGPDPVALGYDVGRLEWLWVACLWLDLVYVGVPAVRNRAATAAFLRRLRSDPPAFVAALVVAAVLGAGTVGPVVFGQPSPDFAYGNQPPVFTSVPGNLVTSCQNAVGDQCHGSWRYPLGTTKAGKGLLTMVVLGARVVVVLSVVTVTTIVPLATVAGTVAAYVGGRVDRAITTVAETLKAVPALLVYLVWRMLAMTDGSLFLLVVTFGLVNWGNVAVVVRSRALGEVSKDYVRAAEAAGAGPLEVVRDHLVPNVSRTATSTAIYQVPLFVTVEATLSFLKFNNTFLLAYPPTKESWGRMIGRGVPYADPYWWRVLVPVAALLATILAMNVFAGHVQRQLDPRGRD